MSYVLNPSPPSTVIFCKLSAANIADTTKFTATGLGVGAYAGWAICNGNNGTDNMASRFVRASTTAAAGTGGSDSSAHAHDEGTYSALFSWDAALKIYGKFRAGVTSWTATHHITPSAGSQGADATVATSGNVVQGTSGAASATDNKPAYYELVPLMRL